MRRRRCFQRLRPSRRPRLNLLRRGCSSRRSASSNRSTTTPPSPWQDCAPISRCRRTSCMPHSQRGGRHLSLRFDVSDCEPQIGISRSCSRQPVRTGRWLHDAPGSIRSERFGRLGRRCRRDSVAEVVPRSGRMRAPGSVSGSSHAMASPSETATRSLPRPDDDPETDAPLP